MSTRLRQWLFRRRKHPRIASSPWAEQRIHEMIAADLANDPDMCIPRPGLPTRHVTRIVEQEETIPRWKDAEATWTMETMRIK